MDAWSLYKDRIEAKGGTKRNTLLQREIRTLKNRLSDGLSYHSVKIDNVSQNVEIINTDNLNIKYIYSLPGEDIPCGGMVYWMDNYWLITEKDANTEIYTRAKMIQCNYLLRWVNTEGNICEQWCIIEDGTKYLTGEYEDRNFIVTRGDSRIAMTIAKNSETSKFERTNRFLIDEPSSKDKLAYALTKPLKVGWTYNNQGVYAFVLQEVTTTDDDNQELGVADYYKYFNKDSINNPDSSSGEPTDITEKVGWI